MREEDRCRRRWNWSDKSFRSREATMSAAGLAEDDPCLALVLCAACRWSQVAGGDGRLCARHARLNATEAASGRSLAAGLAGDACVFRLKPQGSANERRRLVCCRFTSSEAGSWRCPALGIGSNAANTPHRAEGPLPGSSSMSASWRISPGGAIGVSGASRSRLCGSHLKVWPQLRALATDTKRPRAAVLTSPYQGFESSGRSLS